MKKVQSTTRLTSTNSAGLLCVLYKMSEQGEAQRREADSSGGGRATLAVCQLAASLFHFSGSRRRQVVSLQGPKPHSSVLKFKNIYIGAAEKLHFHYGFLSRKVKAIFLEF